MHHGKRIWKTKCKEIDWRLSECPTFRPCELVSFLHIQKGADWGPRYVFSSCFTHRYSARRILEPRRRYLRLGLAVNWIQPYVEYLCKTFLVYPFYLERVIPRRNAVNFRPPPWDPSHRTWTSVQMLLKAPILVETSLPSWVVRQHKARRVQDMCFRSVSLARELL